MVRASFTQSGLLRNEREDSDNDGGDFCFLPSAFRNPSRKSHRPQPPRSALLRMLGATAQQVDGVWQKFDDAFQRLAGAAWAARQIDD